jgi:formamidopyrimidine-DNA glycosylase
MPELPEVETLVRGLRATLPGRCIVGVRLGKTDFLDDPATLERDLPGQRITDVVRHGKFFVLHLESAANHTPHRTLLCHLGMTGHLAPHAPQEPVSPHTHVVLSLDDGRELRYTDPRRFGRMALLTEAELETALAPLGSEPLGISSKELHARLAGRRARIKVLLLDQRVLRGLGNIYADESLWRARIHPMRHAGSLTRQQIARLHRAIHSVLRAAIRLRGSSISDYRDAEGRRGEFQRLHRVYDREGKPCRRCHGKIGRILVSGRSSYFCPRCQRKPRFETGRAKFAKIKGKKQG